MTQHILVVGCMMSYRVVAPELSATEIGDDTSQEGFSLKEKLNDLDKIISGESTFHQVKFKPI